MTTTLRTLHVETILESGEVSLGRWATVVGKSRSIDCGIHEIVVEIGGEDISWAVKLSTSCLMVPRENHIRNLRGNVVEPLLP